ncbi:hypothetical protein DSM3645_24610 [Blastopirellula marina DSM 3645]|uniref:Uncharacterized protein n=1 Tax=Blastopirellula marina DSM 3645 TaxID=314230 RepID=A3ZV13_9BACT|nr:hypothetical protein DSM3645_24610 [Blastopirellula marina DSM 3645]
MAKASGGFRGGKISEIPQTLDMAGPDAKMRMGIGLERFQTRFGSTQM